jgi:predicted nucleic acid-binding protein
MLKKDGNRLLTLAAPNRSAVFTTTCRAATVRERSRRPFFSILLEDGLWNLIPVNAALLRRASALMVSAPRDLFIRTADAVHLTTAQEIGERAVWTNDRHMLAAAPYFGLRGQSV